MIEHFRLADTVTRDSFTTTIESWGPSGRIEESHQGLSASQRSGQPLSLSLHSQRRSEPRFAPVSDRVWVQWWDGADYFGRSARLVNVSRHGAMLLGTMQLPDQQRLRIFLEDLTPQFGIDAVVVSVLIGSKGLHQIHLVFEHACPDAFLEAVAKGFESWLARSGASD